MRTSKVATLPRTPSLKGRGKQTEELAGFLRQRKAGKQEE